MPKNVKNFEIRTLGRDDHAQAAEIFAFVHALHQANRPDTCPVVSWRIWMR